MLSVGVLYVLPPSFRCFGIRLGASIWASVLSYVFGCFLTSGIAKALPYVFVRFA